MDAQDKAASPFIGEDAEELKGRVKLQADMVDRLSGMDFSNKDHWVIQLSEDDSNMTCWIMAEQDKLPAAANLLVQTLTRVIQMADGFGPEAGLQARMAAMSAFKDINNLKPQGEA